MEKIWKEIPGYEGIYRVSNQGDVMSYVRDPKGHLLKAFPKNIKGIVYLAVGLQNGNRNNRHQRQGFVHRLVAAAFLEKPDECNVVDHINTISTDNRVENLRWTTPDGNLKNPISHKRRLEAVRRSNSGMGIFSHKHRGCVQMDMDGNVIKEWGCISDAQRELGISVSSICRTCKGEQQSSHGYKWKYL